MNCSQLDQLNVNAILYGTVVRCPGDVVHSFKDQTICCAWLSDDIQVDSGQCTLTDNVVQDSVGASPLVDDCDIFR